MVPWYSVHVKGSEYTERYSAGVHMFSYFADSLVVLRSNGHVSLNNPLDARVRLVLIARTPQGNARQDEVVII